MKRLQTPAKTSQEKKSSSSSKPDKTGKPFAKFLSLEQSMNDPALQVFKDKDFVCIRDKFPKARVHLLLIPLVLQAGAKLTKVEQLIRLPNSSELLKQMKKVANQVIDNHESKKASESEKTKVKCGFHAVQSMQPLHMHIISEDFDSSCLKTKKHWNSFNTPYFIELDSLIDHLSDLGGQDYFERDTFALKDRPRLDAHLNADIKCHKCENTFRTMPALKKHLAEH